MSFKVERAGRFAREALQAGEGEVCAVFRRSFYVRCPGERYACIGDASLGNGPLNAIVRELSLPRTGERVLASPEGTESWQPPAPVPGQPNLELLEDCGRPAHSRRRPRLPRAREAQRAERPRAAGARRARSLARGQRHRRRSRSSSSALVPVSRPRATTTSAACWSRCAQADARCRPKGCGAGCKPRLKERTSPISAAHLAAAAAGEAHEALHRVLNGELDVDALDAVGHTSGWDALAGAVAVLKNY